MVKAVITRVVYVKLCDILGAKLLTRYEGAMSLGFHLHLLDLREKN
jgi:hypothetical protein